MNATTGLLTYASPRLRRDARTQLTDLQTRFNAIIIALQQSRRKEAADLSLELGVVTEQKNAAQKAADKAQAELESSGERIRAQDKVIADLEAIISSRTA